MLSSLQFVIDIVFFIYHSYQYVLLSIKYLCQFQQMSYII